VLWRAPYNTLIVEPFAPVFEPKVVMLDGQPLDAASPGAVIGGTGLESWAAQEIWAKLFRSEFGESVLPLHVFLELGDPQQVNWVVPQSLQARVGWSAEDWTGLRPDVFAWCPPAGLLMAGLATEEAWDRMAAAVRAV
jgi:hypothetical protein